MPGTVLTVAAPSGAGKTSLVKSLKETLENVVVSVSHTTRVKRPGEEDSVNYFFVNDDEFTAMAAADEFLEYATVFGHSYGTSRQWVEQQLSQGTDVILEIDWQGCQQVRRLYPDSVSIFILPPSLKTLELRLRHRRQDDDQIIAARMAAAKAEISHYREYDFLIINDDFDMAVRDLRSIIRSQRLRLRSQSQRHDKLLEELLD